MAKKIIAPEMAPAPSGGHGVVAFVLVEPDLGVCYPVFLVDVLSQRLLACEKLLTGGTLHKGTHLMGTL
jgi:hypothetical protein